MPEDTSLIPFSIQLYNSKYTNQTLLTDVRLKDWRNILFDEYFSLIERQKNIQTKIKSSNPDEQKLYLEKLDKTNNLIESYQAWISKEKDFIQSQFNKLKPHYCEIMTDYYINGSQWSAILLKNFGSKRNYPERYETYRRQLMGWRKFALKQLLKLDPEEKIAIEKLKKIKKLCKKQQNIKPRDFVNQILAIIG